MLTNNVHIKLILTGDILTISNYSQPIGNSLTALRRRVTLFNTHANVV